MPSPKMTLKRKRRTPTTRPTTCSIMRQVRRAGRVGCLRALVIVFCSIALQSHIKPLLSAVVRPTIFSDLPPDAQATNNLGAAQQVQQQTSQQSPQQPQAQPTAPQTNLPVHMLTTANQHHQYLNNQHGHHWQQQQQQQQQQSDGPQAQKINPLKSRFCAGPNNLRLDQALGLASGAVDDLSLSASSFSNEQVGPHLARLNQNVLGGAWCPNKPISQSTLGQEWIQVKLNRSFVISAIETQGRFALGSGKEFVPSYQVVYSRNNGLTWHKWKDFRGSSLLRANDDVNTAVRNELSPPIVGANVIRILPFSQYLRTVCLRLELFGCQYDEGAPVSYTTSDGVVEPRWGHLIDYTYDGLRHRNGQLSGGLGQLVDGVKGPDNFSFNNGFEWVGWKSMNGDVVVEFTFKTLRNFTGALFHSNNLFSSGVEVFQSVDIHYGIDVGLSMEALKDSLQERRRRQLAAGDSLSRAARQSSEGAEPALGGQQTLWSSDVPSIEYEPDKKAESSRPVTVHLKQRLANKLRFVLKFASKWILISEVEFLSHPVELMSLASLSEQLTPQLMADLRPAKTYDQYVAILREHQLRRIAADEYLNMGGARVHEPGATNAIDQQSEQQQSDQQPDLAQVRPAELPQANEADPLAARRPGQAGQPVWPGAADQSIANPSTNPLLGNQPPALYPSPTSFLGADFADPGRPAVSTLDKMNPAGAGDPQQQQQRRTIGLATVISFVFVGLLGFLGALFAISSYRLRGRSPKLGSPRALPRHLHAGSGGDTGRKGFMGGVFAAAGSSSSSADSASIGSLHRANQYQRHHLTMGPNRQPAYQQQQQQLHRHLRADSHYNPLFASTSGRSSDGSLTKASPGGGPLRTLKKLAAFTTRTGSATSANQDLLTGATQIPPMQQQQQQQQNQLLVSLKDSVSSGGKFKSAGKSQAISTQLIVGLNQANPMAHQQIYQQQQAIYGQQSNPYNSTANSMSLTSSSTLGNGPAGGQRAAEYSLAADNATPDLQPIVQAGPQSQYQQQLVAPPGARQATFAQGDAFRSSARAAPARQLDHNYEQITGDFRFNAATSTVHHQRTLSGNQRQSPAGLACAQQASNAMTLGGNLFLTSSRLARQQQAAAADPSLYYYADTEAAKSCAGKQ